MKNLILCTILAFVAFESSAANVAVAVDLTGKTIQIQSDKYWPRVYINGTELDGTTLGCSNNIPVLSLGSDNAQAEMMYNTLLSAKKAGQTVLIQAKECWGAYSTPLIYSITTY
jgi:hypothetical protein